MTTVTLWGTRGSLAAPGSDTARYGGNTACVEVCGSDGTVLVLDAGTGIRRLGPKLMDKPRIDVLLTHFHMDHIQGLGFFAPLRNAEAEVHIWGPASLAHSLRDRLSRYLSPPLFPVRLRELSCQLLLHEVPDTVQIGPFRITSAFVCHPDSTVGYRIEDENGKIISYLTDHEPALGLNGSFLGPEWTSGADLAAHADLLIHDAQFTDAEYAERVGWGHSAIGDTLAFAKLVGVRRLVPFHHDPAHDDETLDRIFGEAVNKARPSFEVSPGAEGATFEL